MRLLSALALSTVLALPWAAPAPAQDSAPPTITVTGTGTVEAAPDMATLSLGVTTQGDTAATALAQNSAAVAAVLDSLAAAGVQPRDIQTSNLSVNPNWTGYDSSTPTIAGYVATNLVTVRVRQLDALGAVLDAAVADGANTLNGLSFGLADPEPLLDQARIEAVAAARARAELLARAAGVTLGPVLAISEAGAAYDPGPMFRADAAAVPVAGGELGLTASVTIRYRLVD